MKHFRHKVVEDLTKSGNLGQPLHEEPSPIIAENLIVYFSVSCYTCLVFFFKVATHLFVREGGPKSWQGQANEQEVGVGGDVVVQAGESHLGHVH